MTASSKRAPVEKKQPSSGVDLSSKRDSNAPEMPHERDQTAGATGGVPSAKVQQGARDLKRGMQDTSRGAEADQAYQQQKKK